jgi:hypothetical protein
MVEGIAMIPKINKVWPAIHGIHSMDPRRWDQDEHKNEFQGKGYGKVSRNERQEPDKVKLWILFTVQDWIKTVFHATTFLLHASQESVEATSGTTTSPHDYQVRPLLFHGGFSIVSGPSGLSQQ